MRNKVVQKELENIVLNFNDTHTILDIHQVVQFFFSFFSQHFYSTLHRCSKCKLRLSLHHTKVPAKWTQYRLVWLQLDGISKCHIYPTVYPFLWPFYTHIAPSLLYINFIAAGYKHIPYISHWPHYFKSILWLSACYEA